MSSEILVKASLILLINSCIFKLVIFNDDIFSNIFKIAIYNVLHLSISNNVKPLILFIKNVNNIIWKNVKEFLKISKRPPDHFLGFLRKESIYTINWQSESKSDGLILNQKKIKNDFLIDKMKIYLKDYVICKSCKSINTYIEKDKQLRKYNFICVNCNNEYYI